jgi:predicted ATPase/DNA-binding XRE family transcriptional regulator
VEARERASFGARLRRLREASGLSQEALAHRAGLTPNAVGNLERGERRRPYPNTVRALAEALDLDDADRADLIASIPSRGGRTAAASSLPVPPTPLIGREQDVRSIEARFRQRETRLVTLTGPGGVGKTRVAIEVASRLRGAFPDGVAFVDLASLRGAHLVLPTIAQSLGLRQTGPLHEALRAILAPKRLLLALDNFEHVLDAAADIASLLESCPDLAILATSRAPLRIRGEGEYHVSPLKMPDPGSVPRAESVADAPAAQLFLQRAREASPEFSLNQKNAGTIAAICWRLEGLPLALELAAAQVRFLAPATLLSRLDRILQSSGARDLPPRQQTMWATLDWDHDLLSQEERTVFRSLGVFAGGFTLEAAELVIAEEPGSEGTTLDVVGQLVEKSLVMAEAGMARDTTRYRMLEPVREYSFRRLEESGEEHAIRARHADYYSMLAEQAAPGLKRADQLIWLDVLSEEHDNLRATLGYLLEQGATDQAAQIGWNLWPFWALRGHVAEGKGWMEALVAREEGDPGLGHKRALWLIAMFCYMRPDLERMLRLLDEVLEHEEALDQETLTAALILQGQGLAHGEPDAAEVVLERALELARAGDDRWNIPHALHGLAHVAIGRNDLEAAERFATELVAVARTAGERWTLSIGHTIQATVALLQGDDEVAETALQDCNAVAIELQDPITTAYSLMGLALIAGRRKDGERMAHLAGAADALQEKAAIDFAATPWRTLVDNEVGSVREEMGPEEFDLAYSRGKLMTPEQLIGDFARP